MKVDLKVGVWLPRGDEPLVFHVQAQTGEEGVTVRARHIVPPADGALILDARGERLLGWVKPPKRGSVPDATRP